MSADTNVEFILMDRTVLEQGSQKSAIIRRMSFIINPTEISEEWPANVHKMQTKVPGRFIWFDWGKDMPRYTIRGTTGYIIEDAIDNLVFSMLARDITQGRNEKGTVDEVKSKVLESIRSGKMPYTKVLTASRKWTEINQMRSTMYVNYNSADHILIMHYLDRYISGQIDSFDFEVSTKSPWEWKYTIQFRQRIGLSDTILSRRPLGLSFE